MHRRLDSESVLLNLETGVYYGLNETGSFVWSMLEENAPDLGTVYERLKSEYASEAGADEIWSDLLGLIDELLQRDLVRIVENRPSSGDEGQGASSESDTG